MKASRKRPKGAFRCPFGLLIGGAILMPTQVGYQDLAALIAQQPAVTERWRAHVRNSTFGTIHAATFSFPRPMGASIPDPYFTQLASFDPKALDVTGSVPLLAPVDVTIAPPRYDFPRVERRLKGDKLIVTVRPSTPDAPSAKPSPDRSAPAKTEARLLPEPKAEAAAPEAASAKPDTRTSAAPKGDRMARPVPQVDAPNDAAPQGDVAIAALSLDVKPVDAAPVDAAPVEANPAEPPVAEAEIARIDFSETEIADVESGRADIAGMLDPAAIAPAAHAAAKPPVKQPAQVTAPDEAALASKDVAAENAAADEVAADNIAAEDFAAEDAAAPQPDPKVTDWDERGNAAVDQLMRYATPGQKTNRVYFGAHELGVGTGTIQPWTEDEVPTVLAPPHVDPEIKQAARDPQADMSTQDSGETVALKGEVTGEGARPRTPAERLNLSGASRARHEKCLANAIYFDARGEVERGQMAVAQVVLNRVQHRLYPSTICGVVYQNQHKRNACQFSFACDGIPERVTEKKAWAQAEEIAKGVVSGELYLTEVGYATHYHATYVYPHWAPRMTKVTKIGLHVFYHFKRGWKFG